MSRSGETTKHTIRINMVRKLIKVHVRNGEVVFNSPHQRRKDPERPARLRVQVHNKNRIARMGQRSSINDEDESAVRSFGYEGEQLLCGDAFVFGVTEEMW